MSKICPTCKGTGKIKSERKNHNDEPQWQLWEHKFIVTTGKGKRIVFQTEYAFITPDGIIDNYRISAPMGHYPLTMVYDGKTDLTGETLEFIKQFEGWKKSSRKVSQANLARHYLVGEL